MSEKLEGGCLCARVRYAIEGIPENVGHCHCTACRKAAGAAYATFAWVPEDQIAWQGDAPRKYASSDVATRWFCGACGSMLAFKYNEDTGVDISVATLDEPGRVTPTYHTWYASRLAWVDMDGDGLVKYERSSPSSIVKF